MLDLLILGDDLDGVWRSRQVLGWEGGNISVVSRDGLIRLKRLRGSAQDLADIEHLQ